MSKLLSKNGSSIASPRTNVILEKLAFSASAFPTESIADVISRQITFPDSGASARPQAQISAATSSTASVGCGLIRDAA